MKQPETSDETGSRKRPDGRRAFLTYMEPRLIMELKVAALERGVTAFSIVEEAVKDWLRRQPKTGQTKHGDDQ